VIFAAGAVVLAVVAIPFVGIQATARRGGQVPGRVSGAVTGTGNGIGPHQLLVGAAVALLILIPVALAGGWLVAGRFLRPLRDIAVTARVISAGNLGQRLALGPAVAGVIAARRGEAAARGVALTEHLTPAVTAGDSRLIESLIANLIDNAIRHNQPGGYVEVTTGIESGADSGADGWFGGRFGGWFGGRFGGRFGGGFGGRFGGGRVTLTVANTGPIIPADQVERLFQPFQRLAPERNGYGGGYGLGLAIVSAVAQAHHASLDASAPPAGGLSVTVRFAGATGGFAAGDSAQQAQTRI
jgi:hypothetical protein